ncbi:long-chain fatty acid--CoA ligase [bacterium]|nr:long-chain fatty acid--CoA ligase [bacterium]
MASDTIAARLFGTAERTPGRAAYHHKVDGEYQAVSYSEYADLVRRAGKSLMALGVESGDIITILGFNRPEWVVMDVATMAVGGAPAGIYTTSSPEEVRYIASHAQAPLILVENEAQLAKVLAVRASLPDLRWIVTMDGTPPQDDDSILGWDEFLARGDGGDDAAFTQRLETLDEDAVATLIYTSGTTGPPKGVMLTHHNLTWTADAGPDVVPLGADDRSVSYLPLSHIAEQMFTLHIPISLGSEVYFAESIDKLADDLKTVRPTLFFAVPRVWEKFHAGVLAKLAESTGVKHRIGAWAQEVGRKVAHIRNSGQELPKGLKVQYAIADKAVFSKVKAALGFDDCRAAVSGAAPISQEVVEFFAGFDIPILEVYGQSEGSGPTTFNREGRAKFGTVGPPYPGAEVRIADDGEILLRGGNVFAGYYRSPEDTNETLIDGWLHSGDLGAFDDEGFLVITGRKKDIIITAGGKNVAPKNIEGGLKDEPLISEAVVIGDRRKYLSVLITLDQDWCDQLAASQGVAGDVHQSPEARKIVQAAVDRVNADLARVEQVKKFVILSRELSIEEGELTGTLKVKRNVVADHFADAIEGMYSE